MRSTVANFSRLFDRDLVDQDPQDQARPFARLIRRFIVCSIACKNSIDISPTWKRRKEFIAYIRGNGLIRLRRLLGL